MNNTTFQKALNRIKELEKRVSDIERQLESPTEKIISIEDLQKLKKELNDSLPMYASEWRKEMNTIIDGVLTT